MSHLPLEKLPGQAGLKGRVYSNPFSPGTTLTINDNLAATQAPTIANDSTQGYAPGSFWWDLTNQILWTCFDASIGAAVWIALNQTGGSGVPVAACLPYSGAVEPTGFILADGVDRSRTALPDLHARYQVDGYIYGIGDGATTFGVPDYRGRVPVGKDDMGGNDAARMTTGPNRPDGDTLGAAGGLETNLLLIVHMPQHAHTGSAASAGSHTHVISPSVVSDNNTPGTDGPGSADDGTDVSVTQSAGSHTHALSIDNNGSDTPHDNVQPSIIQNYIIKT